MKNYEEINLQQIRLENDELIETHMIEMFPLDAM